MSVPNPVAVTERLILRRIEPSDALFMYRLMTDPTWIENIGDRGLKGEEDTRRYIEERLVSLYERFGFGLYLVELKETGQPIGICGPLRRPSLPEPDLGYALLPEFAGKGYAHEACLRMLAHACDDLKLARILAICAPKNARSIRLLERLGFSFEGRIPVPSATNDSCLYAKALP